MKMEQQTSNQDEVSEREILVLSINPYLTPFVSEFRILSLNLI